MNRIMQGYLDETARYKRLIDRFQKECPHLKVEVLAYPGSFTVRCDNCDKFLWARTTLYGEKIEAGVVDLDDAPR